MSNDINKKIHRLNRNSYVNKNNRISNNAMELKFWDILFDDDDERCAYYLSGDAGYQYSIEASNTMKIANRHGKRNGNK